MDGRSPKIGGQPAEEPGTGSGFGFGTGLVCSGAMAAGPGSSALDAVGVGESGLFGWRASNESMENRLQLETDELVI